MIMQTCQRGGQGIVVVFDVAVVVVVPSFVSLYSTRWSLLLCLCVYRRVICYSKGHFYILL
jgi:hypothetical protein